MKYYKYLDLNWKPTSNKIKELLLTKYSGFLDNNGQGSWRLAPVGLIDDVPEIREMFKPLNLNIQFVGFFVTFKNESSIHIDNDEKPCRINFPILNCENSETRYFKLKHTTYNNVSQNNGLTYRLLEKDSCTQVDKFYLTQAVLMRVLEPHQVALNSEEFPRVSCTVQFEEDISYLLE